MDEEKKELGVSAESEFSLEDILKEFGDEEQEIREKSAEEILSDVEKEALGEYVYLTIKAGGTPDLERMKKYCEAMA